MQLVIRINISPQKSGMRTSEKLIQAIRNPSGIMILCLLVLIEE